MNLSFPCRADEYAKETSEIISGIARKVQTCDLLSSTLQGLDFDLFRKTVAVLKKSAHDDIDRLGMDAVG